MCSTKNRVKAVPVFGAVTAPVGTEILSHTTKIGRSDKIFGHNPELSFIEDR